MPTPTQTTKFPGVSFLTAICGRFFANNGESMKINKRILNDKAKRRFMQLELLCAEYSNLERKQEEDLFSRVQLGVPLTPAEKLRASSGSWQAFAIDIEKQYSELMLSMHPIFTLPSQYMLLTFPTTAVDNRRGRSFQLVLQIFKQILNSDDQYNPKYSSGATALKGFCERPQLLDEAFKGTARRVFHTYNEVLKKHPETFENHSYSHATKYSPIEFVGTAVLINQYPQRNNPSLLSGDILNMRTYLREHRQDLRSNTFTWKCIIEFINELEGFRGGTNVTPQSKYQKGQDMSMDDAGKGLSQFLPSPAHRPPAQLEMPPTPIARTKAVPANRATPVSTSLFLAPSPTSQSPPKPEVMNVRTGHLRFQPPREQPLSAPSTAPEAQRQPPTAPLAQRQPPSAPASQRQPPTAPASQRQLPPKPQLRAPVAPLGQTPTRSVADRFRAVNSNQNPNATPLFSGGVGARGGDSEVGGKRGSMDDGYPGRTEYLNRDGNYSGGQRSNKRNRTEYDIKRERGSHFG